MPGLELTIGPTTEPLCLEDAKKHMRVEIPDDDKYIVSLILAARMYVENTTWRQLLSATWKWYLPRFPMFFVVPKPPLQSVTSIEYVDTAGADQELAPSVYDVDAKSQPGRIVEAYSKSWPSTRDVVNAVTVTFVAGYGAAASDVPAPLVHAIKLMVAQLYEFREQTITGTISTQIANTIEPMLFPYSMAEIA